MTTQPTSAMIAAHTYGSETREQSLTELCYSDPERFEAVTSDLLLNECFERGRAGLELPEYVSGWRYGEVPEGRSLNHRDDRLEPGVSLMGLDGEDETDGTFLMFNRGRAVVRVSGWLCHRRGSDGEPCVIVR